MGLTLPHQPLFIHYRDDDRARSARRSYHDLPLGLMLRTRTGEALSALSQNDDRFLESGRDIHQDQKGVDVPLSSDRFRWEHVGVSLESDARCPGRQALLPQSA